MDKTLKRLETEMVIHDIKENMDMYKELYEADAELKKHRFRALISAGFTQEQALIIIVEADKKPGGKADD